MTTYDFGRGQLCIPLTGAAGHTGGEVCDILNPWGVDVVITRATLWTDTNSTGACGLNIGVGTTAEHDQTELASNVSVAASAGTASNLFACGDAADALVVWEDDKYVTATGHGASSAGFTGKLFLDVIRVG